MNNFHSFNPHIWAQAFKSYVRPCLEYSTVIWNPKNKGIIEKIQKLFTSVTLIKCKKLYEKYDRRLRIFNLESLALRRTIYDLSIIYKIVKSFTHFDPNYFFNFKTRPSRNKHNIQICISKNLIR